MPGHVSPHAHWPYQEPMDARSIQQYRAAMFPVRKTHPLEKSSAQCIDSLADSLQISSQVAKQLGGCLECELGAFLEEASDLSPSPPD